MPNKNNKENKTHSYFTNKSRTFKAYITYVEKPTLTSHLL